MPKKKGRLKKYMDENGVLSEKGHELLKKSLENVGKTSGVAGGATRLERETADKLAASCMERLEKVWPQNPNAPVAFELRVNTRSIVSTGSGEDTIESVELLSVDIKKGGATVSMTSKEIYLLAVGITEILKEYSEYPKKEGV
jgi:hypothetical protein